MRNTKQNRARKVKWARMQTQNNLHLCRSPAKMPKNVKKDANQKSPSLGEAFMQYFNQKIHTRKIQQAKDFASKGVS